MATSNLPSNISYLSKDYEAFREDLINLIPSLFPEWTDFSESDPGIALIELLSYGLDILSYYQDRGANEVYLTTATQKQSVIDLCALIGYRLKTAVPSTANVAFTIDPQPVDYKVPKGFQVSTQATPYETPIIFETDIDLIIPAGNKGNETDAQGNYLYQVAVTQGQTITGEIIGASNGQPNQTFQLQYPSVIIDGAQGSSLHISVNESGSYVEWTDVTNQVNMITDTGRQYTWSIDAYDQLTIQFGDGSSGNIPQVGANIQATYRTGGGANTNVGAGTINQILGNSVVINSVTNPLSAIGGLDEESIEHAKINAPQTLKTSYRAVTANDYATLAKDVIGVGKAQATASSGTVFLTVAPTGGGQPDPELLNSVYLYVNDLKTITTTLVTQNPKYLTTMVTINCTVLPGYSMSQMKTLIQQQLDSALDFDSMDFGQGQYISYLYQVLNQVQGVKFLSIDRFTVNPRVDTVLSSANPAPTWSPITLNSSHQYDGKWKVTMTSATAYQVQYNPSGDGKTWVQDGTGTLGITYSSRSGGTGITFKISSNGGLCAVGDNWSFRTSMFTGNIEVDPDEILILDTDVSINVVGGVA
jgi:uncharacterized phage protein gp47/JayE